MDKMDGEVYYNVDGDFELYAIEIFFWVGIDRIWV